MMTKKRLTSPLQYNDIHNFLICPRLAKKFRPKAAPTPQMHESITDCINKLFMAEMQKGGLPDLKEVGRYWSRRLIELIDAGLLEGRPQVNARRIALNELYGCLRDRFYSKKYQTAAVKCPVSYVTENGIYIATVPAVLNKDGAVYPIFIHQPNTVYKTRNNEIRFALIALISLLGMPVPEYGLIVPTNDYRNYNIESIRVSEEAYDRTRTELQDLIFLMSRSYNLANTEHCNYCQFIHKCKL